MFEKFKQSKFAQNMRGNKAVLITAATLLVTLGVVTGVATAANRARRNPSVTSAHETKPVAPVTTVARGTAAPVDPAADVSTQLPSFRLPVVGHLCKGHDVTMQVFSATMGDYRVHVGLDIAAEENAPVYAAADGTVIEVFEDALMGQCLRISHDGGGETVYRNLAAELPEGIQAGVAVSAGRLIGYVGETAMCEAADEPHLHFEMLVDGACVDPVEYLDAASVAALETDEGYEG